MGITLYSCVLFYSLLHGVNPNVVTAVAQVESNNNPFAVSKDGKDIGLLQIRQKFVPFSKKQLLNSCTNVMIGVEILARAKKACSKCVGRTWVNCFNLGITGAKKLKYPRKWKYYIKVTKAMGEKV